MPESLQDSLRPVRILPDDHAFGDLLTWPFAADPFFEAQIVRLLRTDVPQRALFGNCVIWVYRDSSARTVGFGTLDLCDEYEQFAAGKAHPYIPVLGVYPECQGRGFGRAIVQHLTSQAKGIEESSGGLISNLLFLDVYTANRRAIGLYEKCGFHILNREAPIADTAENNETYFIMAKRLIGT